MKLDDEITIILHIVTVVKRCEKHFGEIKSILPIFVDLKTNL